MNDVCERCFEWDCDGAAGCEFTQVDIDDLFGSCVGCDGLGWCGIIDDGICGDHKACIAFDAIA